MSLSDTAEYWWGVKGYNAKEKTGGRDVEKSNAIKKRNIKIKREFKKRHPSVTHKQMSILAKLNGGYLGIKGKNLEDLKQQ